VEIQAEEKMKNNQLSVGKGSLPAHYQPNHSLERKKISVGKGRKQKGGCRKKESLRETFVAKR